VVGRGGGAVGVGVAVAADAGSCVVERLVLVRPQLPLFGFPEPVLDEGLALGVAVAAAAVADPELGELLLEAAGGEGGAVVAAGRRLARLDRVHERGAGGHGDRFGGAAPELELPGDDLARAAVDDRVRAAPAVLGDRTLVISSCRSCRGRSTRKEPGRVRGSSGRRRSIGFRSRSTLSTRSRLTATPSLRRTNAVTIR